MDLIVLFGKLPNPKTTIKTLILEFFINVTHLMFIFTLFLLICCFFNWNTFTYLVLLLLYIPIETNLTLKHIYNLEYY